MKSANLFMMPLIKDAQLQSIECFKILFKCDVSDLSLIESSYINHLKSNTFLLETEEKNVIFVTKMIIVIIIENIIMMNYMKQKRGESRVF